MVAVAKLVAVAAALHSHHISHQADDKQILQTFISKTLKSKAPWSHSSLLMANSNSLHASWITVDKHS